jgi:hypothetical protein
MGMWISGGGAAIGVTAIVPAPTRTIPAASGERIAACMVTPLAVLTETSRTVRAKNSLQIPIQLKLSNPSILAEPLAIHRNIQ